MSGQTTNSPHQRHNSMRESNLWFVSGALFLVMTLANFSASLAIPAWVFYTGAFALAILLVSLSPPWPASLRPADLPPQNLGRLFLYLALLFVVVEAVWFGFVQKEWSLVAMWLPATLLVGVLLNLAITAGVKRGLPFRFVLIPIISLLAGGLIAFAAPAFGFTNAFPLSFAILALGTGLWLRFRS